MHIAAYVRVSMVVGTDEQNEQRQMHAIPQMHSEEENSNVICWYCVLARVRHRPLGANIGVFVSASTNTMSWLYMILNSLVVLSVFLRQPIKRIIKEFHLEPAGKDHFSYR